MVMRDVGSLESYLTEINRIPLLTQGEEIALAKRLDACRKRLYREILATGYGLQAIVTLVHQVCRGTIRVDRVVELPKPGASENRRILEYLKPTVVVLQGLLAENQTDFALALGKDQAVSLRRLALRRLITRRDKAIHLLEGIRIRRRHLLPILETIRQISQRLDNLSNEVRKMRANPCKRGCAAELQKKLSVLLQTALATPPRLVTDFGELLGATGIRNREDRFVDRQPTTSRFSRQTLRELQPGLPGPYPRGQCRFDASSRSVRPHPRVQVFHLASWWIRQGITRALADESRTIRLPAGMRRHLTDVQTTAARLFQARGFQPSVEETAEAAGLSVNEARLTVRLGRATLSLDQPIGKRQEHCLGTLLADHREDDPFHSTNQDSSKSRISEVLQRLDDREREIIRLRYGLRRRP